MTFIQLNTINLILKETDKNKYSYLSRKDKYQDKFQSTSAPAMTALGLLEISHNGV